MRRWIYAIEKTTPRKFSGPLGVCVDYPRTLTNGQCRPSIGVATRIETLTNGYVDVHDWTLPPTARRRTASAA